MAHEPPRILLRGIGAARLAGTSTAVYAAAVEPGASSRPPITSPHLVGKQAPRGGGDRRSPCGRPKHAGRAFPPSRRRTNAPRPDLMVLLGDCGPNVHPQPEDIRATSIRSAPSCVTMKASAAPRPCSSFMGAGISCASRWRASSTPMVRACIPMTAACSRISSSRALRGRDITVHGDGVQPRSFCYFDDLVDGIVPLMDTADDVTGPNNIGSLSELSMCEHPRSYRRHRIALQDRESAVARRRSAPGPARSPRRATCWDGRRVRCSRRRCCAPSPISRTS
jgi:hypothetical protein